MYGWKVWQDDEMKNQLANVSNFECNIYYVNNVMIPTMMCHPNCLANQIIQFPNMLLLTSDSITHEVVWFN